MSPVYPERPIRPLPKRRLRSRLSTEQAQSITYPPAPPAAGSLFTFPYAPIERPPPEVRVSEPGDDDDGNKCRCDANHKDSIDSDDSEEPALLRASPTVRSYGSPGGLVGGYPRVTSTTSSVDGYDSFENTNNKKKRKIPIPNVSGSSAHTSLSAEMASMGISSREAVTEHNDGPPLSPASAQAAQSGGGVSGSGRGRFGKPGSGRGVERRVLSNSGNLANTTKQGTKRDFGSRAPVKGACSPASTFILTLSAPSEPSSIISTAIANAQSEPPRASSENASLLQLEASRTSPKTQFTFTCGSNSASRLVWPGHAGLYPPVDRASAPPSMPAQPLQPARNQRPVATQGTQTSPNMNNTQQSGKGASSKSAQSNPPAQNPPPKPRRKPSKVYAQAARKRRMEQQAANLHGKLSKEDVWVCEFCEYESIFGEAPAALVRQYEVKDRKERRRLAEKRRLLEKARMKGRKGKKASKNQNKSQGNQSNTASKGYDNNTDDAQDGQDDEYFDEEYDDLTPGKACPNPDCQQPGCQNATQVPKSSDTRGGKAATA